MLENNSRGLIMVGVVVAKDKPYIAFAGQQPMTVGVKKLLKRLTDNEKLRAKGNRRLGGRCPLQQAQRQEDGQTLHFWRQGTHTLGFVQGDTQCGGLQQTAQGVLPRLLAKGKLKKVEQTACMRKLLVTLNSIVKNQSECNPDFADLA